MAKNKLSDLELKAINIIISVAQKLQDINKNRRPEEEEYEAKVKIIYTSLGTTSSRKNYKLSVELENRPGEDLKIEFCNGGIQTVNSPNKINNYAEEILGKLYSRD